MIEWSTEQIWLWEEFFRVPESKISVTRIRTIVPAVRVKFYPPIGTSPPTGTFSNFLCHLELG